MRIVPTLKYIGRRTPARPTLPVALCLALSFMLLLAPPGDAVDLPVHDGIGGEFALQSSLGHEVRLADYQGKVVLLFFGYTSCPDICPANLAHIKTLTKELGPAADDTQVLLVTIDPETDTAERLKEYLGRFDERFVGLTGSREEVDRVAKLFKVKHHKSHGVEVTMEHNRTKAFTDKGFLYAHSQQIYLLDKQGRTRGLYFTGSPVTEMQEAVLTLLKE